MRISYTQLDQSHLGIRQVPEQEYVEPSDKPMSNRSQGYEECT